MENGVAMGLERGVPSPRVEFSVNPQFTLFGGAVIKSQTYRMSDDLGTAAGRPELDQAVLTYTEIRTGLGFDWKIAPAITLTAEAGYLPYREFDFHRTDIRYHHESGAAYGTIALHGAFLVKIAPNGVRKSAFVCAPIRSRRATGQRSVIILRDRSRRRQQSRRTDR